MAKPTMGFYDIPYDIRVLFWRMALQDESRVVHAVLSLREGTDTTTLAGIREGESFTFANNFAASILSARKPSINLALVFLAPEIRISSEFLNSFLQTQLARDTLAESKNIPFVTGLLSVTATLSQDIQARHAFVSNTSRMWTGRMTPEKKALLSRASSLKLSRHLEVSWASHVKLESIALSLRSILDIRGESGAQRDGSDTLKEFMKAISELPHLKTIYIVVDLDVRHGITTFERPRLQKFICRKELVRDDDGTEHKMKQVCNVIDVGYLQAASLVSRRIKRLFLDFKNASLCPEIKSVSWPRSSEEQSEKRKRDEPALIPGNE